MPPNGGIEKAWRKMRKGSQEKSLPRGRLYAQETGALLSISPLSGSCDPSLTFNIIAQMFKNARGLRLLIPNFNSIFLYCYIVAKLFSYVVNTNFYFIIILLQYYSIILFYHLFISILYLCNIVLLEYYHK
jgi:hypothetical protein